MLAVIGRVLSQTLSLLNSLYLEWMTHTTVMFSTRNENCGNPRYFVWQSRYVTQNHQCEGGLLELPPV